MEHEDGHGHGGGVAGCQRPHRAQIAGHFGGPPYAHIPELKNGLILDHMTLNNDEVEEIVAVVSRKNPVRYNAPILHHSRRNIDLCKRQKLPPRLGRCLACSAEAGGIPF